MQEKVKEVMDLLINYSFKVDQFTDIEMKTTNIVDNTRQIEITLRAEKNVVIELFEKENIFGTVTVEVDHMSYSKDLEDLEKVLNNLDKFENPSLEEVEQMKTKWKAESDKRFEETLFKDIEGSEE